MVTCPHKSLVPVAEVCVGPLGVVVGVVDVDAAAAAADAAAAAAAAALLLGVFNGRDRRLGETPERLDVLVDDRLARVFGFVVLRLVRFRSIWPEPEALDR